MESLRNNKDETNCDSFSPSVTGGGGGGGAS